MNYVLLFTLLVAIGLVFVPSKSKKIQRTEPREDLAKETEIPTEVEVRG